MAVSDDDAFQIRPGETAIDLPESHDAGLYFIGKINTPWTDRAKCPKNPAEAHDPCTITLAPDYVPGLQDLATCSHIVVLYFMDRAPRNIIVQKPRHYGEARGVFALRSPARPNPIAMSVAELLSIEGGTLTVRGLDCLDGTPLLDLKPYFPSIDAHPDAVVGWRDREKDDR